MESFHSTELNSDLSTTLISTHFLSKTTGAAFCDLFEFDIVFGRDKTSLFFVWREQCEWRRRRQICLLFLLHLFARKKFSLSSCFGRSAFFHFRNTPFLLTFLTVWFWSFLCVCYLLLDFFEEVLSFLFFVVWVGSLMFTQHSCIWIAQEGRRARAGLHLACL